MGKWVLISFLLIILTESVHGFTETDYRTADSTTYALYEQQRWKELTIIGKNYIKSGIDYYYLRMRVGIAYYALNNYLNAIEHFKKAYELNNLEQTPIYYLYYSYLNVNRESDAEKMLRSLPDNKQKEIRTKEPGIIQSIYLEAGPVFSNNVSANDTIDLDGDENVYGEIFLRDGLGYISGGILFRWNHSVKSYVGYQFYRTNSYQRIQINDEDSLNVKLPVKQHQLYINSSFRIKKTWTISPAFHYIRAQTYYFTASYKTEGNRYNFKNTDINLNDFIISLHIEKDIHIFKAGIFGSYGTVNNQNHFQAGFSFTVYPLGNLNLYSESRLINHNLEGDYSIIFSQLAGFKISKHLWAEGHIMLGQQENFNDRNGYLVYNSPDKTTLTWGTKLIFPFKNISLTIDYQCFQKESNYLTYKASNQGDINNYRGEFVNFTYKNHILLGGISWKL